VSVDVFVQAFARGDPIHIRAEAVRALADPYVIQRSEGFASIQTADGGADFLGYGGDGGLAVVGASGVEIWDLVVAIAQVTGAVIIPVGGSPLVVDALRIDDLPDDVRGTARIVASGSELAIALGIVEDPEM
jgi:hypothetical protein